MTGSPDYFSIVRTQRAHRAFTAEAVPDELVERVLEAATYAPSAENTQPWAFIVVRDDAARGRIGELNRQAWESGGRDFSRPRLSSEVFAKVEAGATVGIANAPVLVVVCGDTSRCVEAVLESSVWPAVQNLLLAARAAGLGAALITLPLWSSVLARRALGLPWNVAPCAVIPLGWPRGRYGPTTRRPVGDVVHVDRYGNQPFRGR